MLKFKEKSHIAPNLMETFDKFGVVEALKEEINNINNSSFLGRGYGGLFEGINIYDDCNVQLLTREEMKLYEEDIKQMQMLYLKKYMDRAKEILYSFKREKEFERIFERLERANCQKPSELREFLQCLKNEIKELKFDVSGELINEIDELIEQLKLNPENTKLLGVFKPKSDIFLCLENIRSESSNIFSNDIKKTFIDLSKSVLIHEYIHFLHHHYMLQPYRHSKNIEKCIKREAVLETVAEAVQKRYIDSLHNTDLLAWINDHSKKAVFPGWPYAGAALLSDYVQYNKVLDRWYEGELLKEIVTVSKDDWEKAYEILDVIAMLNQIDKTHHY